MKRGSKYFLTTCIMLTLWGMTTNLHCQHASAKGDRYFDQNQFSEAIEFYKKDSKSRNRKVKEHSLQRLADCYRITGDYAKAEVIYKKILSRSRKNPIAYLNYGISLMNGARFNEAADQFREYLKVSPEDKMGQVYLQSCDSALKWLDETLGREVRNIYEINTEESEFAPTVLEDDLVFLSARKGSKRKLISFNGEGDVRRLDMYITGIIDIREQKKLQPLSELNTPAHEGPACYSADGTEMYFTKTVKGTRDDWKNEVINTLQIFHRKKDKNGIWSEPVGAFPFNSHEYSVGHPALTSDGSRIYFMSDMPGGFGKTDIYYCIRQTDGTWGKPQNAGPKVNTFAFELFPVFSPNGDFYFASNGHPGMGQLDIFRSKMKDNVPGNPRNVRPPVNSISNDFSISFYGSSERGFFSSDRFNGKGAEDIYAFADEAPLEIVVAAETMILHDYSLFDNITYEIYDSSGTETPTVNKVKGQFVTSITEGRTYVVEASQYGQVINRAYLKYKKNLKLKSISYEVYTTDKPLRISGVNFLGLLPKSERHLQYTERMQSNLRGNRFAQLEMSIDKNGVFTFKVEVEGKTRNVINSLDVPPEK